MAAILDFCYNITAYYLFSSTFARWHYRQPRMPQQLNFKDGRPKPPFWGAISLSSLSLASTFPPLPFILSLPSLPRSGRKVQLGVLGALSFFGVFLYIFRSGNVSDTNHFWFLLWEPKSLTKFSEMNVSSDYIMLGDSSPL